MATNKEIIKKLDCVEQRLTNGELEEIHSTVKEIKEILNILTEISFNIEELSYIFNKKNFANVNVEEKLEQIDNM